jgi:hypothetical protein
LNVWVQKKEQELKKFRESARNGDAEAQLMILRNKKLFKVASTSAAPLAYRMA